jgi:hypothetical protein
MSCLFYGRAAILSFERMIDTGGNQCALVTDAHAPCVMEDNPGGPCLMHCYRHAWAQAPQFVHWPVLGRAEAAAAEEARDAD